MIRALAAAGLAVSVAASALAAPGERIVVVAPRIPSGVFVWQGAAAGLGPPRVLRGAAFAALSSDGRRLATAFELPNRRLELRLLPVGGGAGRVLGRIAGTTTALAFSPDGALVAYASPTGIELVATASRARRPVEVPPRWRGSAYSSLAFSPDGRLLAFTRTWGDGRKGTLGSELDVVGVDGRGPRRLYRVRDPFSEQPRPTFAPDGSRIAFLVGERSIFTVPVGGGRPARVTAPPPRSSDGDPVYSPKGDWLAFPRTPRNGTADVYLVRPDGTGPRRLTTTPIPGQGEPHVGSSPLVWSPDATRVLAFRHDRFAVVEVATRRSVDLRRTGVLDAVGPARWQAS